MERQKIVTIGGGTGSFTILSELKKYPVEISAIVSMADDGGSTGILRDELGVLPPGDVRQCLVALSESDQTMRDFFNFRYSRGGLSGHSFGNLFLSTLEKITGSFDEAIREAAKILRIKGSVIPVTLTNTKLMAVFGNGKKIVGQHKIDNSNLISLEEMKLKPKAELNPEAVRAIRAANKIIINPGNLFCSIIPSFLVKGLSEAVKNSSAKKIYICNLMTKSGHTDDFSVADYVKIIEKYLGKGAIECVIYNKEYPETELLKKYENKGEYFVAPGALSDFPGIKFFGHDLLSEKTYKQTKGDKLKRTLIRHDSDKIAKLVYNL